MAEQRPGGARADAAERMLAWLLTVQLGIYLVFVGLWFQGADGLTESEEWRSFVFGWALVPATAVGLYAGLRALGRRIAGGWPRAQLLLAILNALLLFAATVGLRCSASGWAFLSVPGLGEPSMERVLRPSFEWVGLGFALGLPLSNLGLLLWLRTRASGFLQLGLERLPIAAGLPLLAAATAITAGVQRLSTPALLLAVVGAWLFATLVYRVRRRTGSGWFPDALVVAVIAVLSFDFHLHFDAVHHNWYLGALPGLMHGRLPLADFVAAYGVLPFYLLALFFRSTSLPISYVGLALATSLLSFVFYALVYFLLRAIVSSQRVAVASMAAVLATHFFGVHGAYTAYPSGGPLRFLPPFLVLLPCALRASRSRGQRVSRLAEIALLVMASLWSAESFVYTLAAFGGVAAVEIAFARKRTGGWLRYALRRCAPALGCISVVHVAHALVLRGVSGEWPHWDRYLELIASFSPRGGIALVAAPLGGAWVLVVLVYLGSLIACAHALPFVRSHRSEARLAVVTGLTLTGIAQLSYWLGLSIGYRLSNVCIPALLVAAYWGEGLQRSRDLPTAFRAASTLCLSMALVLIAMQYASHMEMWLRHSRPDSLGSAPAVAQLGGCDAFPACVLQPRVVYPETETALELLDRYAPRQPELAVFLSAPATTEVSIRSGKPHAFPVVDPLHDALVGRNAAWIERQPHGLVAGDAILVDEAVLHASGLSGESLLRRLFERLCANEFSCDEVERRGAIRVLRLAPRHRSRPPRESPTR